MRNVPAEQVAFERSSRAGRLNISVVSRKHLVELQANTLPPL